MRAIRLHHQWARNILHHRLGNNTNRSHNQLQLPALSRPRQSASVCSVSLATIFTTPTYYHREGTRNSLRHLHCKRLTSGHPQQNRINQITRPSSNYPLFIPYQSNIASGTSLVAVGLVGCVLLLYSHFARDSQNSRLDSILEPHQEILENNPTFSDNWSKMTGELLPDRPGTLSPEQDEKLREFWTVTLQVFGVLDKNAGSRTSTDFLSGSSPNTDTGSGEKHKKKRLGLFGRKKNAETGTSASTVSSGGASAADDDKYGQTKQFHDALANQSPEVLRTTFWSMVKHDHPDALLLRFLRARKWDVEKALIMMVSTMNWRATEMHVDDDIMISGEMGAVEAIKGTNPAQKKLGEDFLAQMRMGKSFLHGTDKAGRPMCIVRARLHKQGEQSEESLERYTVFVIETARMCLTPPVDTACVVFDMTGFSMANMDYTPVKFMIKCFEANYPESLGVVLVHKAPWVFQGIWKIIKGWLDPVVASKVKFTNSADEMEEFVAKGHILKELGGEEDWSYQYIEPVPGENSRMADTDTKGKLLAERQRIIKNYEQTTLDWIENGTNSNSAQVMAKRNVLASELKEDYWKLDPYVRAKCVYDRYGVLQPGGRLQFYPSKAEAPGPAINGMSKPETSVDDLD